MIKKVKYAAKKEIEEEKRRQKEYFKERYNQVKRFEFPTKDKINMERHFYFPKFLSHDYNWQLSKSSLAIYPVLCSKADFKKNDWFQISQQDIARMAGISTMQVRIGIDEMKVKYSISLSENQKSISLLEKVYKSEGSRHYYMYRVGFIRQDMISKVQGMYFIFYTCIIDSGVWANLTSRAKSLYLALRTEAEFDALAYFDIEYDGVTPFDAADFFDYNGECFRNRKWDVCRKSLSELCSLANIESSNIKLVLQQLERHGLAERVDGLFKVFLKPTKLRYGD